MARGDHDASQDALDAVLCRFRKASSCLADSLVKRRRGRQLYEDVQCRGEDLNVGSHIERPVMVFYWSSVREDSLAVIVDVHQIADRWAGGGLLLHNRVGGLARAV
jgi:hypothetical protein